MIKRGGAAHGLMFILQIALSATLVWVFLRMAGIPNPYWAVITVCVVAEPDFSQAISLSKARVINTMVGCAVALIFLSAFGSSFASVLAAMSATTLCVVAIERYPTSWRLAPATTVMLMMAAPSTGLTTEAQFALMRAGEITAGALTTLMVAWLQATVIRRLHGTANTSPP